MDSRAWLIEIRRGMVMGFQVVADGTARSGGKLRDRWHRRLVLGQLFAPEADKWPNCEQYIT